MINVYYQFEKEIGKGKIKVQDMQGYGVLLEEEYKNKEDFDKAFAEVKEKYTNNTNYCEMCY